MSIAKIAAFTSPPPGQSYKKTSRYSIGKTKVRSVPSLSSRAAAAPGSAANNGNWCDRPPRRHGGTSSRKSGSDLKTALRALPLCGRRPAAAGTLASGGNPAGPAGNAPEIHSGGRPVPRETTSGAGSADCGGDARRRTWGQENATAWSVRGSAGSGGPGGRARNSPSPGRRDCRYRPCPAGSPHECGAAEIRPRMDCAASGKRACAGRRRAGAPAEAFARSQCHRMCTALKPPVYRAVLPVCA